MSEARDGQAPVTTDAATDAATDAKSGAESGVGLGAAAGPDIAFRQSRFGMRTSFAFVDDHLIYSVQDSSGIKSARVPYFRLSPASRHRLRIDNARYEWRLRLLVLLITLTGFAVLRIDQAVGLVVILAGLGAALALAAAGHRRVFTTPLTLVPVQGDRLSTALKALCVIEDRRADAILGELDRRWRAQMRAQHGRVDPAGDRVTQETKLDWLYDSGVIDRAEYEAGIALLAPDSPVVSMRQPDQLPI